MRKKQKGGAKWAMLVNERMKRSWAQREGKSVEKVNVAKEWEWDEEMGDRVKGLLGREVVRKVKWCQAQEEGLVGKDEEGVVVRIGGEGEVVEGYDLRGMVNEEMLAELRELVDGAEELVLRKHPKSTFAHLALEALKNYVEGSGL